MMSPRGVFKRPSIATAMIVTLLSARLASASSYCPEAEDIAVAACHAAANAAGAAAQLAADVAAAFEEALWDSLTPEEQAAPGAAVAHYDILIAISAALMAALNAILAALNACLAAAALIC